MRTRNLIASAFGIWFIFAPWVLGLSNDSAIVFTSALFGVVQSVASCLALKKSSFNVLENWVSLLTGIWFAIFSISFSLSFSATWTIGVLGICTVCLNLWNMDSTLQS
ncbi:SPW repeat domain-containing protein [Paenibacillus agricola]|uniref:SPW repeat-containing integral membrane domain-containing protein n=1 Tax=Paenibacillus agricola TaxID=2716264 RepID=A0ABX0J8S3_9BACL|nr:SPW repeat protein [Paenibacillus agricola]NHN31795.1 hypothetical protein [Paenibacillus agricola]